MSDPRSFLRERPRHHRGSTHRRTHRAPGWRAGCLGALGLAALGACAPDYGSVELEAINTPPVEVVLRAELIEIPAGIAVVVEATPNADRGNYDETTAVDLYSEDRGVLTVHRRDRPRQFALVGVTPGETCLEVWIDRVQQECVEVEITAPTD